MWLCFNDAFISAVQDRDDPSRLCVRARNREHLKQLFPTETIINTPDADYLCRVFVTKTAFSNLLVRRVEDIDYTNFKDSVTETDLHNLYNGFWMDHLGYQERTKTSSRTSSARPSTGKRLDW